MSIQIGTVWYHPANGEKERRGEDAEEEDAEAT